MPLPQLRRRRRPSPHTPPHIATNGSVPTVRMPRLRGRLSWRTFWKIIGSLAALGSIALILLVAWVSQALPDPDNLSNRSVAESTKIFARDGKTVLYEIHGDQKRTVIDLANVNPAVIQATIATEDRNFYTHRGISIRGILRSIFVDITHRTTAQGGSTITQQLVRNAILTREKTITRKVKEIVLSYQIERRYTKEQILKLYFNEIPYGGSAYGVEAASRMYFGKSASDIDIAESAMLAAIVKGPSYYSPTGPHRDELVDRTKFVIENMVEAGYITRAEADAAKKVDILDRIQPVRDPVIAPHFTFYIRDQLVQKYGELQVERGGLRVVTTLDPKLQKIAEEEVAAGAKKNDRRGAGNASLVAVDPKTGQILALVGSRDFFDKARDGQFNVATAVRNPGSSFKPIVYLGSFLKGYSPDTILFDLKTNFGPDGSGRDFVPNNYDGREHGPLRMRQTLAGSLNIPAVQTLYLAGINPTLDLAEKLGYSTIDRSRVGLALAIGGGGVRLTEHVGAFAVLANDGVRNSVTGILRVEDKNGKVLEQFKKNDSRVVDQNANRLLVDVMSDNSARAFVFGSRSPLVLSGRPVAAKTGTTNDWKDGWTVGFTPSLAAGVWVGNNNNKPMNRGMDGVVVAAPIWHNFMARATSGTKVERFPKPRSAKQTKPILQGKLAQETTILVDAETGKKIPDRCVSAWPSAYVKQVTIKEVHSILYYVQKDDPNGPAPEDPNADPMYSRWEKPVAAWAKKNRYIQKLPAEESCSLRINASAPSLTITTPSNEATITDDTLPAAVSLQNFGPTVSVAYSIDSRVVATSSTAPYGAEIDLTSIENGYHTLRAEASDTEGHAASASVNFNLSTQSGTTLYFVQPSAGSIYSASGPPITFRVFASDSRGIFSVELWVENPSGTKSRAAQISNPPESITTFSWSPPVSGTYRFSVIAKSGSGKSTQSDRLSVVVRD